MQPDPILPYARPADPRGPITARGAAAVACRLIALWLFAQSVQGVVSALGYLLSSAVNRSSRSADVYFGLVGLIVVIGPVTAGWLLWASADRIARRLVPDDAIIGPVGELQLQPLMTVGLVMVGVSTAAQAIHGLVGAAVLASQRHTSFALWWHDESWLRASASDGVLLTLSAWLIFGGRGLADFVRRARTAGHPPRPTDHPAAE